MAQGWPKVGKRVDDGKHAFSVVEVVSSALGTSNEMRGWGFGGGWRQSARRCGGFSGSGVSIYKGISTQALAFTRGLAVFTPGAAFGLF